jgi:hypothetical protein
MECRLRQGEASRLSPERSDANRSRYPCAPSLQEFENSQCQVRGVSCVIDADSTNGDAGRQLRDGEKSVYTIERSCRERNANDWKSRYGRHSSWESGREARASDDDLDATALGLAREAQRLVRLAVRAGDDELEGNVGLPQNGQGRLYSWFVRRRANENEDLGRLLQRALRQAAATVAASMME